MASRITLRQSKASCKAASMKAADSSGEPAWGGDLAKEAAFAAKVVQKASELCLKLAAEMETAEESLGKEMSQDAVQKGISIIKEGDATPVTAADFAIQGFISKELQEAFPKDRFMGEEDATSLREDDALCVMANNLAVASPPFAPRVLALSDRH
eukprot:1297829-Rhodomonas_salina.2